MPRRQGLHEPHGNPGGFSTTARHSRPPLENPSIPDAPQWNWPGPLHNADFARESCDTPRRLRRLSARAGAPLLCQKARARAWPARDAEPAANNARRLRVLAGPRPDAAGSDRGPGAPQIDWDQRPAFFQRWRPPRPIFLTPGAWPPG